MQCHCMWTNEIDHQGKAVIMWRGFRQFPKIFLQGKTREKNCTSALYCPDPMFGFKKILYMPFQHCPTPYPSRNNGQSLSQLRKFSYSSYNTHSTLFAYYSVKSCSLRNICLDDVNFCSNFFVLLNQSLLYANNIFW